MRISRRFGSPHCSFVYGPEPGPRAVAVPRACSRARVASMIGRSARRTRSGSRPRPGRRWCRARRSRVAGGTCVSGRCGRSQYQSMSPMWPLRQARTKRTGTTARFFLFVVDELALGQRLAMHQQARARSRAGLRRLDVLGDEPLGNCQAVMPVVGAVGSSWSGGGA